MTPVYVSPITRFHLIAVVEIERLSYDHPRVAADFEAVCRDPRSETLVAHLGNRSFGYVSYLAGNNTVILYGLAVHPDFRRQGVGHQLISRMLVKARDGCGLARATLRESQTAGCEFLKAIGFGSKLLRDHFGTEDGIGFEYQVQRVGAKTLAEGRAIR